MLSPMDDGLQKKEMTVVLRWQPNRQATILGQCNLRMAKVESGIPLQTPHLSLGLCLTDGRGEASSPSNGPSSNAEPPAGRPTSAMSASPCTARGVTPWAAPPLCPLDNCCKALCRMGLSSRVARITIVPWVPVDWSKRSPQRPWANLRVRVPR